MLKTPNLWLWTCNSQLAEYPTFFMNSLSVYAYSTLCALVLLGLLYNAQATAPKQLSILWTFTADFCYCWLQTLYQDSHFQKHLSSSSCIYLCKTLFILVAVQFFLLCWLPELAAELYAAHASWPACQYHAKIHSDHSIMVVESVIWHTGPKSV